MVCNPWDPDCRDYCLTDTLFAYIRKYMIGELPLQNRSACQK